MSIETKALEAAEKQEQPAGENQGTENPAGDNPAGDNPVLWTAHAGGFSATTDAYAVDKNEHNGNRGIWLISMLGAQVAVRAIAAALLNKNPKPVTLTPGAEGLAINEQMMQCQPPYATFGTWTTRIIKMANGMGYHNMTFTRLGEYAFNSKNFLLITQEGQDEAEQYRRYLDKRISVPIHGSWSQWLWERAQERREVEELECIGIRAWHCRPVIKNLEQEISQAIRQGKLGAGG